MLSCVLLVPDIPISADANRGYSNRVFSHIRLLHGAGCEIHLVQFVIPQDASQDPGAVSREVSTMIRSHRRVQLGTKGRNTPAILRGAAMIHDPAAFLLGDILHPDGLAAVRAIVEREQPDLIWSENIYAASLAHRLRTQTPVVFSHHDWYWLVRKFYPGSHTLKQRLFRLLYRRHEKALVRSIKHAVTGSQQELHEIRGFGAVNAEYLPTTFPAVNIEAVATGGAPRIVHVGALGHFVNRISLHRFVDIVWPKILERSGGATSPRLDVVGETNEPELAARLASVGANCTGIVPDLRTILRPYDIHIVPWEHDTGTRTRVSLAMNHGQVVVGVRRGVACLEELVDQVNCVIVENIEDMADAILALLEQDDRRRELGEAARLTFETRFTVGALQARFDSFLDRVVRPPSDPEADPVLLPGSGATDARRSPRITCSSVPWHSRPQFRHRRV